MISSSPSVHTASRPPAKLQDANEPLLQYDLLPIIERHFFKMAGALLVCWLIGAIYFVLAEPSYESRAEILLEPKDTAVAIGAMENSAGVARTLSDDSMASHLVMIQSTRLLSEALEKAGLTEIPSVLESMESDQRTPVEYLQDNLLVTRGGTGASKKANTLKLRLVHGNAEDAKLILDAIVKHFQEFVEEKFVDDKEKLIQTINQAQGLNQKELDAANAEYRKFRQDVPILWNGRDSTNVPRMLYEEIQTELNALKLKRTEIESRLKVVRDRLVEIERREAAEPMKKGVCDIERIALIDETSAERVNILLQVFAGDAQTAEFQSAQPLRLSAAQAETAGLAELKSRKQKLILQFGPQHPELEALNAQIVEMDKFINEKYRQTSFGLDESIIEPKTLIDAYVRLLENDLTDIESKQVELQNQSVKAEREARELVHYELEGEVLRDHVDDLRTLYDATIEKLKDINLAAGYGGLINEVLEFPEVGKLEWPKLPIVLAVSTLLGLLSGAGISLAFELKNGRLRTAQEIERTADLPILGQVPRLMSVSDPDYLNAVRKSGSDLDRMLCTAHDSKSQEAEVFRGIRTVLFFRTAELKAKTIAITSSNSGDGKSMLSGNLAVSIAQAGRSVLVIECDLRRPAVAKLFNRTEIVGLSDVLSQSVTLEKAIVSTELERLDILSAGKLPSNPAELLASDQFRDLVKKAEAQYDFVILDCPPVLAVTDPCIVSSVAGAVVLVVKVTDHSRVELRRTVEMLNEVNASTIGLVINSSSLEDEAGSGRKNGYMVGYGYGAHGAKANGYYHTKASNSVVANRKS
jgi:capsular exopolysaccharide synthesis family protein